MPVVFLDLDGVLVDFVRGAFRTHGRSIPIKDVRWGFPEQIGFSGTNDPAFWEPFNHDFWANLDWHTEGRELLTKIEWCVGRDSIALMTSPCETPGSVEGKVSWVKRNLPQYSRQLFVGPAKHLAAGPSKILIDDHDGNIEKFRAHGGKAIVVPRPWNCLSESTNEHGEFDIDETLAVLRGTWNGIVEGDGHDGTSSPSPRRLQSSLPCR